jgi:hypothetical protein
MSFSRGSSSSWMLEEAPRGGTPEGVFQVSSILMKVEGEVKAKVPPCSTSIDSLHI